MQKRFINEKQRQEKRKDEDYDEEVEEALEEEVSKSDCRKHGRICAE